MNHKSTSTLLLTTLAGVIIGAILGYYLPEPMLSFSFIGQLFVNALRVILIPFIVAAVITGVVAMADLKRISRSTGKTLAYFVGTSFIAVIIGLILAVAIQPGAGVNVASDLSEAARQAPSMSVSGVLSSILPENIAGAIGQGQLLWLVILSIVIGAVLISIGSRGKAVRDFFESLFEVMLRLAQIIFYVAPIGLLSLVATAVAENGWSPQQMGGTLGAFSLTVLVGLAIQGAIVLPLVLKFLAGRPVWQYFVSTFPATAVAFATASPAASLPVTYHLVTEKSKVDNRAGALTLPLGAIINMNGTAVYLVIAALFCAQAFSVDLSIIQIIMVAISVLLVSLAVSLLPNVALLALGVVLYSAGFPPAAYAGIGMILVVDWLFDRLRAAVNVWSDVVGSAVISETFEFKTARRVKPFETTRRGAPGRGTDRRKRKETPPSGAERQGQESRSQRPVQDQPTRGKGRQRERKQSDRQGRRQRPRQREDSRQRPTADRHAKEARRSEFTMPPPPYHVLETELKSHKTAGRTEASRRGAAAAGIPDETLERERVRVAEQLEKLRAKDKPEAGDAADRQPTQPIQVDSDAGDMPEEKSVDTSPRVDYSSDDTSLIEEAEAAKSGEDVAPYPEEPAAGPETGEESQRPVTYGRGKHRRIPTMKPTASEESEKEQAEKTPTEGPEFSSENISFGRSKRKKPGG